MFKINWEKKTAAMLPQETIYKMIHLAFPKKTLISYEIIKGGCANLNVKIHLSNYPNPFILRIYMRDKEAAYREQNLALLLKDTIPIPVSHYIGNIDDYRFAIVDYLPGVPLRELLIKPQPSHTITQLMYDVGVILSKISSLKFKETGFFDENLNIISDNNSNIMEYVNECLKDHTVTTILGIEIIEEIKIYFKKFRDLLPDPNSKNLVHGDFDPANILVTESNGNLQISGILDWEFAFAGSTLWDVANMLRYSHKMPHEFKDTFINSLTANGVVLPDNWQITINLLNITSLLDCLKRADVHNKPKQCADILELIKHILSPKL